MIDEILKNYPENSDLTIMNTFYQYPIFDNGRKICDDFLVLVYKNNETKKKEFKIINKPEYTYYKLKDKKDHVDYNRLFIERDKVDEISVPFTDLEKSIAKETGNIDFYKQNLANRAKSENRKLHTDPDIFFSDTNIEDHYRFKFSNMYTNNIEKINKSFLQVQKK